MDARKTSDLGNKEILARNLQNYLDLAHKTRNDLAKDLGFKYTTVSNWLQAERYPFQKKSSGEYLPTTAIRNHT